MSRPPYPKYKLSGVAWLPTIPITWQPKRGRYVANVNPVSPVYRGLFSDQEVSIVPMDNVGEWGGLRLDLTATKADQSNSSLTEFQDGDVVIAKITPCFENGKGAIAEGLQNGAALGTTELHVWRPYDSTNVRFLFYLTTSQPFRALGEAEMYGAGGQKRVPPDFLKNLKIGLPPLDEQAQIAEFLDRETAKIDMMIARNRELIELLQEYRSALISAAVTGKIDVRKEVTA
jgi:type I restriction enzyme S subunit